MESRVQQHLDGVAQLHRKGAISLASVILFGSAATGAFSQSSDVDLIIVVPDGTSPENRCLLRAEVTELEILHGLRLTVSRPQKPLESFAEHAGGHAHSCFLCTPADLVSGDVARIFGLRGAEEMFLERVRVSNAPCCAASFSGGLGL
jgi:predicted nucleotidyltransferase